MSFPPTSFSFPRDFSDHHSLPIFLLWTAVSSSSWEPHHSVPQSFFSSWGTYHLTSQYFLLYFGILASYSLAPFLPLSPLCCVLSPFAPFLFSGTLLFCLFPTPGIPVPYPSVPFNLLQLPTSCHSLISFLLIHFPFQFSFCPMSSG